MGCAARLLLFCCIGCSSNAEPIPAPVPPAECLPPNRLVGERCIEPGVRDDGCPAGTASVEAGDCQPAGVTPELCADGWTHDGNAGCEPMLPATPCPAGQMALPGDASCQPVLPCGTGTWGDIPVDGATIHVDASYFGGASDGSAASPFTTIGDALVAAGDGALIAVAGGSYPEDLVLDKPVRLHGVCPEQVEVAGGNAFATIEIRPPAHASELRGLAVTGGAIVVSGVTGVLLRGLWVHDSPVRAVDIEGTLGRTAVTVEQCLLEQNYELGVLVLGAQATLDGLVVRGTSPQTGSNLAGRGLHIQENPSTGDASSATVTRSLIEQNHDFGVFVRGSQATLDGLIVRSTLPQAASQEFGRGVAFEATAAGAPATAIVRRSLVADNHEHGVLVSGSEVTLEGVVVRATLPRASDQRYGWGIGVEPDSSTDAPAHVIVDRSLIEQNHELGLFVGASQATLSRLVVRGTLPRPTDQAAGRGIDVEAHFASGAPATVLLEGSVVEGNHEVGVLASGSEVTLDGVHVRGTLPRASDQRVGSGIVVQHTPVTGAAANAVMIGSLVEDNHDAGIVVTASQATLDGVAVRDTRPQLGDGLFGRGINIQWDGETAAPATARVASSLVENNHDIGLVAVASHVTLERLLVRATQPRASDGLFGDGVIVASAILPDGPLVAVASLDLTRIEENARAGLANFGGQVSLRDIALSCNAIDLNGEAFLEAPFAFDNLGGNACGCPAEPDTCAAKSSGLTPPVTLPDP